MGRLIKLKFVIYCDVFMTNWAFCYNPKKKRRIPLRFACLQNHWAL